MYMLLHIAVRNMKAAEIFKKKFSGAMKKPGAKVAFARKFGTSRVTIDAWCSGKTVPSIDRLDDIAAALETTVQSLVSNPEEPLQALDHGLDECARRVYEFFRHPTQAQITEAVENAQRILNQDDEEDRSKGQ